MYRWLYLLPLMMEYCVIINLYNGDLLGIAEPIEYSFYSVPVLMFMLGLVKRGHEIPISEIFIVCIIILTYLQWALHSPFEEWPEWWPAEKTEDDERHRTEWYDTHVMVFGVYFVMFMKC